MLPLTSLPKFLTLKPLGCHFFFYIFTLIIDCIQLEAPKM